MKATGIVSPSRGRIELEEYRVDEPGPNEVQVRVHVSLVSPGTERAWVMNMQNTPGKYPFRPGYCAAGIVEKVGSQVSNFVPGDRVVCYTLPHCSLGNVDEKWVVKIPEEVTFEEAVFLPLGQIALQGVRKSHIELGENVMIIGLGLIGQLALQFAALCGALPVMGVDRIESRLKTALACGAHMVVNSENPEWMEDIDDKPQVVIEATGNPGAVSVAFKAVAPLGRVVLLGSTRGESTVNFYTDVHVKGITVVGAHGFHSIPKYESRPGYWTWYDDVKCFMKFLKNGKLLIKPLVTHNVKWVEVIDTYSKMLEGDPDMLGILINWQEN